MQRRCSGAHIAMILNSVGLLVDFQAFDDRSVAITAAKNYDTKSDGYEDKKAQEDLIKPPFVLVGATSKLTASQCNSSVCVSSIH